MSEISGFMHNENHTEAAAQSLTTDELTSVHDDHIKGLALFTNDDHQKATVCLSNTSE